jgi:hypothetical protein
MLRHLKPGVGTAHTSRGLQQMSRYTEVMWVLFIMHILAIHAEFTPRNHRCQMYEGQYVSFKFVVSLGFVTA